MPIQVIEPRRLYVQIASQIRSLIAAGEFAPGSRLPAERELAKRFGVSRPSLREALIALEVEGHVDVRPGAGILVTTPQSVMAAGPEEAGPLEVLQARILLEGEVAAEAARDIRPKDVAALEQILLPMEAETADPPARLAGDRQFHRYIAAKLANKVLLRLVMGLVDQRDSPLARQFATHFDNPKTWTAVSAEHRKILAALAARDPKRARKAMRDHLRKAHRRWAQNLDRDVEAGVSDGPRRPSIDADGLASRG
jgi:GntR family transcriptional repressor for pyruvate dehydrogenase complex